MNPYRLSRMGTVASHASIDRVVEEAKGGGNRDMLTVESARIRGTRPRFVRPYHLDST